jgi:CRP-like cAMP-binding protein
MDDLVKENFNPYDYIFFEGDLDYHFYIIESGQVQIFTKTKAGKRVNILTLVPGESFGEFAMLLKLPRSASAQALTECQLIKVTETGYQKLMGELPDWASCMMRSFATRLSNMNALLKDLPQFIPKGSSSNKN